jgi:hypothetical protein
VREPVTSSLYVIRADRHADLRFPCSLASRSGEVMCSQPPGYRPGCHRSFIRGALHLDSPGNLDQHPLTVPPNAVWWHSSIAGWAPYTAIPQLAQFKCEAIRLRLLGLSFAGRVRLRKRGDFVTRLRRLAVALGLAAVLTVGSAAAAFANAPPPTNGGNGAGHSGQCTGNPSDRPASCGP